MLEDQTHSDNTYKMHFCRSLKGDGGVVVCEQQVKKLRDEIKIIRIKISMPDYFSNS